MTTVQDITKTLNESNKGRNVTDVATLVFERHVEPLEAALAELRAPKTITKMEPKATTLKRIETTLLERNTDHDPAYSVAAIVFDRHIAPIRAMTAELRSMVTKLGEAENVTAALFERCHDCGISFELCYDGDDNEAELKVLREFMDDEEGSKPIFYHSFSDTPINEIFKSALLSIEEHRAKAPTVAKVEPERILCAAIHVLDGSEGVHQPVKTGYVIGGHHHAACIATLTSFTGLPAPKSTKGFITNENRYVDRVEARSIALASGQVTTTSMKTELCSEDLNYRA